MSIPTPIDLTKPEQEISTLVSDLILEGHSLVEACEHALKALPNPRPEFVLWVSAGTLARVGTENYRVADLEVTC